MNNRIVVALPFFALLALQTACVVVDGSPGGDRATRTSDPGDFDGIAIATGFDSIEVDVCGDCDAEVRLSGDDRQIDDVTLEITNGTLEIDRKSTLVITDIDLQAKIRVPSLRQFVNTGSADTTISDVRAEVFELVSTGSGDTTVKGAVGVLDVVVTGSGEVSAYGLTADSVQVIASGSGDAEVCANERLEAQTTGSGNVFYDCSPEDMDSNSTGSGKVSVR